MCSYSYMDHTLIESANLPTCRRIYKLVSATGPNTYFLVHYLSDKGFAEGSTDKMSEINMADTMNSAFSTSDEYSLLCDTFF